MAELLDILPDEPEPTEKTQEAAALEAECLVAMTGIFPKRAPSELEIVGGRNYLARVRRRIAAFLDAKESGKLIWQRPPSQKQLMRDLSTPLDQAEVAEWIADLPVLTGFNYPLIVKSARDYILAKWPKYEEGGLGLHNHDLAPDEYGDVWHITRTLHDPETIFDDLDALLLLPEQMEAIAAVYPSLLAEMKKMAGLLIFPFIEVDGAVEAKKVLASAREEQLRVFMQVPAEGPIKIVQDEAKQPKQSAPSEREYDHDSQLPSERVAQVRTAKGTR